MQTKEYLTVSKVAARLGISKVEVVLAWIHNGELLATNVGSNPKGRPTWRVCEADFEAFVNARRAVPTVKPERRARRRRQGYTVEYF
jgi:excisionase family DNA binding protein